MWRRKDIKEQGKAALKRSYWKSVLVSLLLSLVLGSSVGASFGNGFTDGISGGQEASDAVHPTRGMRIMKALRERKSVKQGRWPPPLCS